jgi:hypothetical protein
MPFDQDSGLVFNEKIIKKSRVRTKNRSNPARSLGQPPERQSSGDGTDSLFSVTLRKLLCNLDKLDPDSLSTVPEVVLKQIWKATQRS